MDIHYKMIEHERTQDAPFIGALVCANSCKFKCKGCFNRSIKKMETIVNTAEEIVDIIKANPFNQGIILGGLEWSLQPLELLELVKVASNQGLLVMIQTGCEPKEFDISIGKACFKHINPESAKWEETEDVFAAIGNMAIDYYIDQDYYIKFGRYDRELHTDVKENFGVKLASENQFIVKFIKEKVDNADDEGNC